MSMNLPHIGPLGCLEWSVASPIPFSRCSSESGRAVCRLRCHEQQSQWRFMPGSGSAVGGKVQQLSWQGVGAGAGMEASGSGREEARGMKRNAIGSRPGGSSGRARERRHQKAAEEKKRKVEEPQGSYPEWATVLESACKDDIELREIIGDSVGDPEEMRKRVEERVRRKGRDILSPKSGSATPMTVVFKADFDPLNTYIWLELYGEPSDKDVETIGNVLTSWYLLGKLGAYNSMNIQLTELPVNAKLTYSQDRAAEAMASMFHNIEDLEFQDNWGRFWVDLGTSDPVAMDILINALTNVSSDHVGIKQLVFGGEKLGDWDEGLTNPEDGYKSYKI